MNKANDVRPFGHELIFPFRGNWNTLWVMYRYLRTSLSGLKPGKFSNAVLALVEMSFGKTYVRSRPSVLRIEPTNLCNLHCPRCSCGVNIDPRRKGYLALDDYRLVLEENQNNAIAVRLDGMGEPTLHPRIFEMIKLAKSYGYAVSMSTNLNTDRCAEIEEFIDSGLDRLIVSVDGSTQASYEKYRVGGNLALVEDRLGILLNIRKKCGSKVPFVEVQFLDWDYNHADIPDVRRKSRMLGVDKFVVIAPDWAVTNAQANPGKPRRCHWLWWVLTVDWTLNYLCCAGAFTMPWPRVNLKDIPSHKFWNHSLMIEARQYNINKSSEIIASDVGCLCNNCNDMLVVNRPEGYICK